MPGPVRQPPPRHKFRPPPILTPFHLPSAPFFHHSNSSQTQPQHDDSMPEVDTTGNGKHKSSFPDDADEGDLGQYRMEPHRELASPLPFLERDDSSNNKDSGEGPATHLRLPHTVSTASKRLWARPTKPWRRQTGSYFDHVETGLAEVEEEELREKRIRPKRAESNASQITIVDLEGDGLPEGEEDGDGDGDGDELHDDDGGVTEEGTERESDDGEPYSVTIRKRREARMTPSQQWCFYFFEEPQSVLAKTFSAISSFFIVVSVVVVCVQSLPQFEQPAVNDWYQRNLWLPLECVVNGVFTIEYLGRLYAATKKLRFMTSFMNIVDLISILPFYVAFVIPSQEAQSAIRFIRVLRLFRIVKVFQFSKYSVGLHIASRVFRNSVDQIVMVSTYILVIILVSSALMHYIERGSWDGQQWMRYNPTSGVYEVSPFQSIAHGFYWSIVTLTTTGYGDMVPYTVWGRVVSAFTMLGGILAIAIPTSIIGSNFMNEWAEYRRLQFQARLRKNQKRAAAESGSASPIYSGLAGNHGKKIQMRMVKEQNYVMLETLAEIQEKLANINPPRYYRKYAKTKIELQEAVAHIAKLELEIARLRKVNTNLNKFNSLFKKQSGGGDLNSVAATGGMDDEFTQLTDASSPTENDLNATFSITGKAREKSVAVLNTIFRRGTTAANSGAATPALLRTEANNSVNTSVSNTLTKVAAVLARTLTEPSGNEWHSMPGTTDGSEAGDKPQPMRLAGSGFGRSSGQHRRWTSNNGSQITIRSVEEREGPPSRSGGSVLDNILEPPMPRTMLEQVTTSLHRMAIPPWRRSNTEDLDGGVRDFERSLSDMGPGRAGRKAGRERKRKVMPVGRITKEMIGKPMDLRRAYTPSPERRVAPWDEDGAEEGMGTHERRSLGEGEGEDMLSTRTVPATNREMRSVLGDRYGQWMTERLGRDSVGRMEAVRRKDGAASASPSTRRAGESLLNLFEPSLTATKLPILDKESNGAGVSHVVLMAEPEMIQVVVHSPSDDGALDGTEKFHDADATVAENCDEYLPLPLSPSRSATSSARPRVVHTIPLSTPPALPQEEYFRRALFQRWGRTQGLSLFEGEQHGESENINVRVSPNIHCGEGSEDVGTMWLGSGEGVPVQDDEDSARRGNTDSVKMTLKSHTDIASWAPDR